MYFRYIIIVYDTILSESNLMLHELLSNYGLNMHKSGYTLRYIATNKVDVCPNWHPHSSYTLHILPLKYCMGKIREECNLQIRSKMLYPKFYQQLLDFKI